ncbi:MAG: hypothetical protein WB778_02600 [Thermoplasmata archaeon]
MACNPSGLVFRLSPGIYLVIPPLNLEIEETIEEENQEDDVEPDSQTRYDSWDYVVPNCPIHPEVEFDAANEACPRCLAEQLAEAEEDRVRHEEETGLSSPDDDPPQPIEDVDAADNKEGL